MLDALFGAASGRAVLVALVLLLAVGYAMFQVGPYPSLAARDAPLPEETPGMPAEEVHAFLDGLGEDGRTRYARFQALDTLHAALLAAFATLLAAWILRRAGAARGGWRLLALVPPLAFGAELLENAALARATALFPERAASASVLPVVTTLKFAAIVAMLVALVACLWLRLRAAVAARRGRA